MSNELGAGSAINIRSFRVCLSIDYFLAKISGFLIGGQFNLRKPEHVLNKYTFTKKILT